MKRYRGLKHLICLLALLGVVSTAVYADKGRGNDDRREWRDQRGEYERHPKGYRLDKRYRHDRYYPPSGYNVKTLPPRHYDLHYHGTRYYYDGGSWYRPSGTRFIVVAPPFGIVVPFLPRFYATIWVGGIPYYYANDVYYTWSPERNGYVVTEPPANISEQTVQPLAEELFIYPSQGQSEQKQADDRYACHSWGVKQTGYDPSRPPENMSREELVSKREDYQRAMKACLEGRGYSVR